MVWTQWFTANMSNAVLPHSLAVFAVSSMLVYCYDLRPVYDIKKFYVLEGWNVAKSGHQYHPYS